MIVWRAASKLGVGPHDASPAIDAGLVEIGVRVWFRHPLVRSAAYGSAALADRQAAHRELAQATDPDLDPDRRAWHRALGAPGPDDDIAEALERSADRARRRGGLAAAAALLERSVALTLDPSRRGERILAAAAAHLEAGSFDVAAGLLASAEATPLDEMGRAQLDLLRARHASWGGDLRDAPALLLRAAKRLEPLDVSFAGATYLQALAAACVAGNFARGVSLGDIARAARMCPSSVAPTTGDWVVAGLAQVTVEGPAAAAPLLRRALAATATDTVAAEAFHWLGYQCGAASVLWDSDSLHRLAALQATATRDLGALTMLPWALNTLAHLLTLEGDLERASSLIAEANEIVEATGSNLLPWAGAILAGWQGGGDSLRSIDGLVARARAAGHGLALKSGQWASAIFHNGMGQYEQALAVATEADRQPWEWGAQNFFHELIEAAARCGQLAVANAALERLAATVEPSGTDWGARPPRQIARAPLHRSGGRGSLQRGNRSPEPEHDPPGARARPSALRRVAPAGEPAGRRPRAAPHRTRDVDRHGDPTVSPSGRGTSCSRRARPCASAAPTRSTSSRRRRHTSRGSPPTVTRTRRSARSSSSARVPSSGTFARSSPSSTSRHDGNSARRCLLDRPG